VQCLGDTSSWTPLCLLASPQWTDMLEARYCTNQHSTSHVTPAHHSPPVQPQPSLHKSTQNFTCYFSTSQSTSTTTTITAQINTELHMLLQHITVHQYNHNHHCTNQHSTSHVTPAHHSPPVPPQPQQSTLVHNSMNTCTLHEFSGDYKNCNCLWTVDECSQVISYSNNLWTVYVTQ